MQNEQSTTRRRRLSGLAGTATALAVVVGFALAPSAAHAAETTTPPSASAPATGPEASLSAADQAELETLLAATDSATGTFDAAKALGAGASEQAVADYAASYEAAGQNVTGLVETVRAQTSEAGERVAAAASSCTGDRGYTGFYGWGWQWALNSCDTDLLMAALAGGGGAVAAVGGVISAAGVTAPAGAVTAAAGGLVAAGAGIVSICKAASYEKKAIYLNAFVTGSVGCWGQ
ncbi:hypothetical protein [Microbacterium enclense]|uniref:hypothetical protein n=1 Tax=Microbacterium enclense TaxID=993073 RepID=UPI003F7E1B76